MTEPIVTMEHVRAVRMCSRGARQWFAHHGLDYSAFLATGLPVSVIEATGDALGQKVAAEARRQAQEGSDQ